MSFCDEHGLYFLVNTAPGILLINFLKKDRGNLKAGCLLLWQPVFG
jgi:hypothetical protein